MNSVDAKVFQSGYDLYKAYVRGHVNVENGLPVLETAGLKAYALPGVQISRGEGRLWNLHTNSIITLPGTFTKAFVQLIWVKDCKTLVAVDVITDRADTMRLVGADLRRLEPYIESGDA